jgi:Large eukaryotic DNA virus major capsid protein/Major capsid protein N-terminus
VRAIDVYFPGDMYKAQGVRMSKGGLINFMVGFDDDLTGIETSHFRTKYKRHTKFAMEAKTVRSVEAVAWGKKLTFVVPRDADMLQQIVVQIKVPRLHEQACDPNNMVCLGTWSRYLGLAMLKQIDLELDNTAIDRRYGEWMYIWKELKAQEQSSFEYMVGVDVDPFTERTLYVPLDFWFCGSSEDALPIMSMHCCDVKVTLHIREFEECVCGTHCNRVPLQDVCLLCHYTFIDVIEKRLIAEAQPATLLCEQLQRIEVGAVACQVNVDLTPLNFAVKELVFVVQNEASLDRRDWFEFTHGNNVNPVKQATLQISGLDRTEVFPGDYFNVLQPFLHHGKVPMNAGVNVYSFALHPGSMQPSGTLNFSRVHSAELRITLHDDYFEGSANAIVRVYALSYNRLVVSGGKAQMMYS